MSQPKLLNLGRRERQIMDALYRLQRATVNDVLTEVPDPPSYSAVRAMLGKLEQKGYVTHVQDGPRYVYEPVVSPEKARKTALQHVVRTFFDGSTEQALVALVRLSDTELDEAALERLTQEVKRARKEGR